MLVNNKHPNIIEGFGFSQDLDANTISIFMQYADQGDLASLIRAGHRPSSQQAEIALAEMTDALSFLHSGAGTGTTIVRRDIKPGNIFELRGHFVLADFHYGTKVDVFALGVIIFKCMTGKLPFEALDVFSRLAETKAANLEFRPGFEDVVPSHRAMFSFSPHGRPDTDVLKKNPRLDRALLVRDLDLERRRNISSDQTIKALEARDTAHLQNQLAIAAQLSVASQEIRNLRARIALLQPSTRLDKDDVIAKCRAMLNSFAASTEPDVSASAGSKPMNRSRVTSLKIAEAMSVAAARLQQETPDAKSFCRSNLMQRAIELSKLGKATSDEQVQTFLHSSSQWKVDKKSWTCLG
ncbi:unnamed protein product [Tilletia controversa]|nr:unnamed protein product [Tilletia controversa]